MTDAHWWQELRAEFRYLDEHVFAWSGGQAPMAGSVRAAIGRVLTAAAVAMLAEHRIATLPELQLVRLDLHAFNSEEDVARILDCFAAIRAGAGEDRDG
jgi:hypothetical protein